MSALERFVTLITASPDAVPLDEGCLLIAGCANPDAEIDGIVDSGVRALDDLAAGCPGSTIDDLRAYLFDSLGFTGNRIEYADPRNSYLDEVLRRRTGIPITLAVVAIEVGRRLGLPLEPVGMPGHFLVGLGDGRYMDAFDGGRVLDEYGSRRLFIAVTGAGASWSQDLLDPVPATAVLARILANLRQVFVDANDLVNLDWVLELRTAIPSVPSRERAERASVLSALGRYDEAASQLEQLAELEEAGQPLNASRHPSGGPAPSGEGASELRNHAARLRAQLN